MKTCAGLAALVLLFGACTTTSTGEGTSEPTPSASTVNPMDDESSDSYVPQDKQLDDATCARFGAALEKVWGLKAEKQACIVSSKDTGHVALAIGVPGDKKDCDALAAKKAPQAFPPGAKPEFVTTAAGPGVRSFDDTDPKRLTGYGMVCVKEMPVLITVEAKDKAQALASVDAALDAMAQK